jgi:hypothetical protein
MQFNKQTQISVCLQLLYELAGDEGRWQALIWQVPISLVIHRFQYYPHAQTPQETWSPGQKQFRQFSETEIKYCLQFLYHLPLQVIQSYQAAISEHILPQLRILPYIGSLESGIMPCQQLIFDLRPNFMLTVEFYNRVWTCLIIRLGRKGDPRTHALKLPRNPSLEEKFTYMIGCRYHGTVYRKMFPDSSPIPDAGDRHDGQFHAYAEAQGFDINNEKIIRKAIKTGRYLLAIEEALKCLGISLAIISVIRWLDQTKASEVYKLISLLECFQEFPDIIQLGNRLSPYTCIYQDHFNNQIAAYTQRGQ